MCVHIIQRYDDTMKEKGGEGRERKEREIYIYKIYRVGSLLSAGFVSVRQHALPLCARAYIPAYSHAHIRIHAHKLWMRTILEVKCNLHACMIVWVCVCVCLKVCVCVCV